MAKILFLPFSVIGGLLAGKLATTAFQRLWRVFDDHEAPDPQHRDITLKKLIPALVLEGAIDPRPGTRGSDCERHRRLFDHGTPQAFGRLTRTWPGEEQPRYSVTY
jgi:hypothetical protein